MKLKNLNHSRGNKYNINIKIQNSKTFESNYKRKREKVVQFHGDIDPLSIFDY